MNAPIMRLFMVIVVLFALLVLWTSRWTVFDSKALQDSPLNKRTLIDELKIKRGRILADDGTVLAKSVRGPDHTWTRTYPTGSLFAQAIGYSNLSEGEAAGLELSRGRELRGIQTGLSSVFGQLSGSTQVGDDVYTTLDPKAQELARSELAGRVGSVVAIDPRTGAVKVMYANPSYDDNHPSSTAGGASRFDRSLQSHYPPGSTFKVVTAAAALDSGKYTPDSTIDGKSPITVSGVPLENDLNQPFGLVTLTYALTQSINTVFAQVGEALGRQTMTQYMKRFGFYALPPLDFPPDEMAASGERTPPPKNKLFPPTSPLADLGRMSIGQDKLTVTPMQMAMVAAAVANHGTLMVPHLTNRVVNQDGQTVEEIKPQTYTQVMKPSSADDLAKMMTNVVDEGTGQAARLNGLTVAGKTGTASISPPGSTEPWFICFAPVEDPKIAVAVTIERTPGEFGGQVAAPIAASIIKQLLGAGQ